MKKYNVLKSLIVTCLAAVFMIATPVKASAVEVDGATVIADAETIKVGTEYVTAVGARATNYYYKFTTSATDSFYFFQTYNISTSAHSVSSYADMNFTICDKYGQTYLTNKHVRPNYGGAGWKTSDIKLEPEKTYYVCVNTGGWGDDGYPFPGYVKFKIGRKADTVGDTKATAKSISRNEDYTSNIASDADTDWYTFKTGDETVYEFYAKNVETSVHSWSNDLYLRPSIVNATDETMAGLRLRYGEEGVTSVTLKPNTKYYVVIDNPYNAGSATRYAEKGTYIFEVRKPKIVSSDITLSSETFTYDGTKKKPDVTVVHNGITLVKGKDYTVSYSYNTNAGTASAKVTGIGNYKGTATKKFTINPQVLQGSNFTVSTTKFTYSGSSKKASVKVKNQAGTLLEKGTDYKVTYANNVNAGKATVKVTGIGNYTGELTGTFTIHQQEVKDSKVKLKKTKYVYDGSAKTPGVSVYDNQDEKLTEGTDYTLSYASGRAAVGKYAVVVNFRGNYIGSKTLYFVVAPAAPTSAVAELRARKSGFDDVKFKWSESTGASGYYVYYRLSTADDYTYLKATTSNRAYIDDLKDGKKYYFKVVPYYKDAEGTKHKSTAYKTDTVYTLKKIGQPTVSKASSSKITVKWSNIKGETGYQISRSTSKTGTNVYKSVKSSSAKQLTFTTTAGKGYYYKVRAYRTVDGEKVYGPWSTVKYYKLAK